MAAKEMGGVSPLDALSPCELLAKHDPARSERAFSLARSVDRGTPPSLVEVALAAERWWRLLSVYRPTRTPAGAVARHRWSAIESEALVCSA
jgi:hypothetical protein